MKKLFILVALLPLFCQLSAQKLNYKFGRIADDELKMEVYDQDTSAVAVIIYEDADLDYDFTIGEKMNYNYRTRIKILKQDGTRYADVQIPLREHQGTKEAMMGLDAYAYNLEDGKVVKTPLKKSNIFREKVNDNLTVLKFSIPEVKAGTVIEYKYTKSSGFIWDIPDAQMQHEIPVMHSRVLYTIPEWFAIRLNVNGYYRIGQDVSKATSSIKFGHDLMSVDVNKYLFWADDMPALKKESMVWHYEDFITKVEFEVSGFVIPGIIYKTYSTTWASVNNHLSKTDFGRWIKMSNPLKEEVAIINAQYTDPYEKARAVLKLVQSKVRWNKVYTLVSFDNNPRNALKNGEGNSAQINFLIISALKDVGLQAVPVMLNPRHKGRMPYTRPSVDKINTFVVMVYMPEDKYVFIDGCDVDSELNVIPPQIMVDRTRIYGVDDHSGWVNLTNLVPNMRRISLIGNVDDDGGLDINEQSVFYNLESYIMKKRYANAGSEDKYIEELEKANGIRISDCEIKGLDMPVVHQTLKYSKKVDSTGDIIYINASVNEFMSKNPLNEQQRVLPIEFSHPYSFEVTCSIAIPEGYGVDGMPENISMNACENGAQYILLGQVAAGRVTTKTTFKLNRVIFSQEEYDDLRTFFGMVADRSKSMIVLKKNG